jgi:DNA-binding transcriptional ArsR family regulator
MLSDGDLPLGPTGRPEDFSQVIAAAASPRRREILRIVWNQERTAGDIHRGMPDVTFGAVSLQLKALLQAGLVETRAERRFHYYRARREAFGPVGQMLEGMWGDALSRLKLAAELEESRRGPRPRPARAPSENQKEKIP